MTDTHTEKLHAVHTLESEIERLQQWVNDLQAGMYINCVYCGHRYGPDTEVPATMADVLKAHVEQCPAHPMSALKRQRNELLALVKEAHTDTVNDFDSFVQTNTNADGEFMDAEDKQIADELCDFIERMGAAIAKAESNDNNS